MAEQSVENDQCPSDGQTLAWHQHSEVGPDGRPRTNGEFIGCAFGAEPVRSHVRCGSVQCAECYPLTAARISTPSEGGAS